MMRSAPHGQSTLKPESLIVSAGELLSEGPSLRSPGKSAAVRL